MNIVYLGVPNPIAVAARGYPCSRLILLSDNGVVERADGACNFNLTVVRLPIAHLRLCTLHGADTVVVAQQDFRVKRPDPAVARVGTTHLGTMKKAQLAQQDGIVAFLPGFDFNGCQVTKFTLILITVSGNTQSFRNLTGARFTPKMKMALSTISAGDLVVVADIESERRAGGYKEELAPVQIRVVD